MSRFPFFGVDEFGQVNAGGLDAAECCSPGWALVGPIDALSSGCAVLRNGTKE